MIEPVLQIGTDLESKSLQQLWRDVLTVFVPRHPVPEPHGTRIFRRQQPEFFDNFLKRSLRSTRGYNRRRIREMWVSAPHCRSLENQDIFICDWLATHFRPRVTGRPSSGEALSWVRSVRMPAAVQYLAHRPRVARQGNVDESHPRGPDPRHPK